MGVFLALWLVNMGLNITRDAWLHQRHTVPATVTVDPTKPGTPTVTGQGSPLPPKPGKIIVGSGIFVALAIVGEVQTWRTLAILGATAYDVALAMNFAVDYQTYSKYPVEESLFWTPPAAADNTVFPAGKTASTPANATPSSTPIAPPAQIPPAVA